MGLRINTNLASLTAQRQLSLSQRQTEGNMKALASGNKFSNPAESAAEHSIGEQLRGQVAGVKAGRVNAENALSFVQIAEGGLNEQNNILIRLRELAVQAASDTFSDSERAMIQMEFEQLQQEISRIAETTRFGSNKLLAGEKREYEFQVGSYKGGENIVTYRAETDTRGTALGTDGLRVDDKSDARDSLETIDEALAKITTARASFGAIQSRLESTASHAGTMEEALEGARSKIADTDVAQATSAMYRNQALQQYQIAVLNEANRFPGNVLRLIA